MALFNEFYTAYTRFLAWIAATAGLVLFLLAWGVSFNAVSRKVFGFPIAGTTEVTEALMPLIIMLPMAYTQFRRGHVRVTLLLDRSPPKLARALDLLALIAGFLFMAWAAWATWGYAMRAYEIGETAWGIVRFVIWPTKFCISIGAALLSLQFLLDIIMMAAGDDDGFEREEPPARVDI